MVKAFPPKLQGHPETLEFFNTSKFRPEFLPFFFHMFFFPGDQRFFCTKRGGEMEKKININNLNDSKW